MSINYLEFRQNMKFSVLLPTHNGEEHLSTCIKSILCQDYDDMELIVYDNANTDSSRSPVWSLNKRLLIYTIEINHADVDRIIRISSSN